MTTLTSEDIYAIRTALRIAGESTLLSTDVYYMESALTKLEDVIDKHRIPRQHSEFVLLPLLAKNDEE